MAHAPSVSIFQKTVTRNGVRKKTSTWYLAWRDSTGELIIESTGIKNKKDAKLVASEKQRQLALDPYGLVSESAKHRNMAWEPFVKEFIADREVRCRPATAIVYDDSLKAFTDLVKPKLLREVTITKIDKFVTGRLANDIEPPTVNKDLRHLRAALNWAKARDYIAVAPCFKSMFITEDERDPVVIPEAHIDQLFAAIKTAKLTKRSSDWWQVFLTIAYGLGLRMGEILGLTWEQVDLASGQLRVAPDTSKSRRWRILYLVDLLPGTLRSWHAASGSPKTGAVLPWGDGKGRDRRQLYVDWRRITKAAGLPDYVPKNCRSSYGSGLVAVTGAHGHAKAALGHASVTTTEKFYVAHDAGLRAAMEGLGKVRQEAREARAEARKTG